MILSDEFATLCLIFGRGRWLPGHVVNLALGPDVILRRAMTIEAPLHVERLRFASERHLVDLAMAGRTPDSLGYVNAMIEINEIRKVVDATPAERPVCGQTVPDRGEHRCFHP